MRLSIAAIFSWFLLCFSQTSLGMDEPPRFNQLGPGIEIPSKPELTGLASPGFSTPEMELSWRNLVPFSQQTMANFNNDIKKGILYVHSLETNFGAGGFSEGNFKGFVENYIDYLAHRPIIAGSVLAYNDDPMFTLPDTFASISFIFEVPAECIAVTARSDARTPYNTSYDEKEWAKRGRNILKEYLNKEKPSATLDAIIRLPNIGPCGTDMCVADMNEIAILNCAISGDNVYRPRVVGVLYNEKAYTGKFDYGNADKNAKLKDAALIWSGENNLPFICPPIIEPCHTKVFKDTVWGAWFGKRESYDHIQSNAPFDLKDRRFLLDENQLKTYLLTPANILSQYGQIYENKLLENYTKEAILLEKAFYEGDLSAIKNILLSCDQLGINNIKFPCLSPYFKYFNIIDLIRRYHGPDKLELILFLFAQGLSAHSLDSLGRSLFLNLVIFEEKSIYWKLLARGFINLKDEIEINAGENLNIFCEAVDMNDLELLRLLLQSNVDWSNVKILLDYFSESPLFWAVKKDNDEAIRILLESNIDWSRPELNNPKIKNKEYDKYKARIMELLKK